MTWRRLRTACFNLGDVAGRAIAVVVFTWRHPANEKRRLSAVLRVIRFQALGRILGRRAIAPVGERSAIYADADVYHSARAMYGNPLDWNEMSAWRDALGPGSLFVDVGANVGLYTIWAADAGAQVVAIEPNRDSRERLKANLELNGYAVEVVGAAIADSEGTLRMTTGLDNQNHLLVSCTGSVAPASEPVPVRTLDALLGDRVVDGLKADVEGAELLVLKGARRLLSQQRIRLIQLEWNRESLRLLGEGREPIAELLASYSYELFRPDASGSLVPVSDPDFGADVFARPALT